MSARKPLFLVVEGLDGAGKSTVVRALSTALCAVELRTPSDALAPMRADILRCLERSPLATTLFYASTVAAAAAEVRERLAAGQPVVMDRYLLSTCAYGEVVRGVEHPAALLTQLAATLTPADVTIYLHASRACRRARILQRGHLVAEDRLSFELGVAERLHAAFDRLSAHPLAGRWLPLDTTETDVAHVVTQTLDALARWGLRSAEGGAA